jgi:triacylglycerol lipase
MLATWGARCALLASGGSMGCAPSRADAVGAEESARDGAAGAEESARDGAAGAEESARDGAVGNDDPARGFTPDFRAFLDGAGYGAFDFARGDLSGPSAYGGRTRERAPIARDPVVFVHGNSDRGLGGALFGWEASVAYFRAHGYSSAELYAFTWGPASAPLAPQQYHSRAHLTRTRAFLEAVLAYTGAEHIDVIGHSMGVTLARKAIAGGAASDLLDGGAYELGPALTAHVDAFVGISGGNLGLSSCFLTGATTPTCGATNGFYPGTRAGVGPVVGRSAFLDALLSSPHCEGEHVYSIWSPGDEVLGAGALVWGESTATVPAEDGAVVLDASCGHMPSKSGTVAAQLALVADHRPSTAPTSCAP